MGRGDAAHKRRWKRDVGSGWK